MADHPPSDKRPPRTATRLAHMGRDPHEHYGFVNIPVYRGSTILFETMERLEKRDQPYTYGRRGTPTVDALERSVSELEGGARTVTAPSGLAAISATLLALVEAGDHILMTDSVYQPTRQLCDHTLRRLGVETEYYDPLAGAGIAALMRENTRLVFVESPGSQTLEVQDIPAIASVARDRGAWVVADNTWASPLYCSPLALGADVSIQAGTKYIAGHSDTNLGTVTANERAALPIVRGIQGMGVCAGSEEVYMGLRGLRTMQVRLERHWRSGLALARWLAGRPEVARVLHPGLEDDPGHALFRRDFTGASGLFSVVLHPVGDTALAALLDDLAYFGMGFSWGGFESLAIPFDPRGYRTATAWHAEGPALRLHIGLEDPDDLIADLDAGFARMKQAM